MIEKQIYTEEAFLSIKRKVGEPPEHQKAEQIHKGLNLQVRNCQHDQMDQARRSTPQEG